jgi:transcriptional regulator
MPGTRVRLRRPEHRPIAPGIHVFCMIWPDRSCRGNNSHGRMAAPNKAAAMHIIRHQFRMAEQQALAFAAARGFGVIVANDEHGPRGSHVPFVVTERDGCAIVQLHLTAKNPLVPLADGIRRFLLIVSGDDAYVSNDWYASHDNVSTWLYEAVHLSGVAHLREYEANRSHGDALLTVSEARLPKQPWDLAQMEPNKRETMLASIRVIDLVVDRIEGQSKLNHHKSDEDHVAVANQLARAEETGSRRLAQKMRGLRPELGYDFAGPESE